MTDFAVSYSSDKSELLLRQLYRYSTLGPDAVPVINTTTGNTLVAPAEVQVAPDGSFLVSNRNLTGLIDTSVPPSNFDTIASFSPPSKRGYSLWRPLLNLQGLTPRGMELNADGTLLAVAFQRSAELVVLKQSGLANVSLGSPLFDVEVARYKFSDGTMQQPVSILWGK